MRALIREAGAAFAVLSIYVLTLLMPLHQAAATQRGFAELGYETTGIWSICTAMADAQSDSETPTAAKCPMAGTGKKDLALAMLPAAAPVRLGPAVDAARFGTLPVPPSSTYYTDAYPRAPPALA